MWQLTILYLAISGGAVESVQWAEVFPDLAACKNETEEIIIFYEPSKERVIAKCEMTAPAPPA